MVEIIKRGDPHSLEEVSRDFEPDTYREYDLNRGQLAALGVFPPQEIWHWVTYRVASVYAVSKVDADKIVALHSILGRGTGEGPVEIPCTEWAWVQDWKDSREEKLKARSAKRAARLEQWRGIMNEGLVREAHEQEARKVGRSQFGYGGQTQRVKA